MKKILIAALLATPAAAHAQDWFQFEAALGAVAYSPDSGDGQWQQQGNSTSRERLRTPAYLAGFTGKLYESGPWAVRYHLDYTYIGQTAASCACVDDSAYDAKAHVITNLASPRYRFYGLGHTQGVAFTIEPSYTWHGITFAVEAGPWVYWPTWHDTVYMPDGSVQSFSHNTTAQVSYVVGARVTWGNLWLSYRYYDNKATWNPYPGLIEKSHVVSLGYTF